MAMFRSIAHRLPGTEEVLADEGRLPSFDRATAWIGSEPLTPADLRGRVVLVDFWTYTCVNWLRTLPYLRAWDAKYSGDGLTIVGVHTPEFGFEHDLDNVATQARRLGIGYPIAVDSDYGVWDEFANHYWPAVYLADHSGRIRFHHFGEGEYERTEMMIQRLLVDAGAAAIDMDLVAVEPHGLEVAADWRSLRSPETYLGYGQSSGFASEDSDSWDRQREYAGAERLTLNSWDLHGRWTQFRHAAVSGGSGARISFRFHARDLNLVMGPATSKEDVGFRVLLDGHPVDPRDAGSDLRDDGTGVVRGQGTYQLVRQAGGVEDRLFEIVIDDAVEVYSFTFG